MLDFFVRMSIMIPAPDIEDLCNGSTPDSDSVCGGSNPSSSAMKTPSTLVDGVFNYVCPYGPVMLPNGSDATVL